MFLRTTIYCDTSIQIYLISSHDFKYSSIWQWNWLFQKRHIVSDNMTDVFLMVRRLKSTFFLMCKEKDTVAVVKRMLAGIVKKELEEIRIYQQRENLESGKNWFEEKDGKEILLKNLFCLRVGWLCQPWISGLFSDQLQASVTWGHGRRLEGRNPRGELDIFTLDSFSASSHLYYSHLPSPFCRSPHTLQLQHCQMWWSHWTWRRKRHLPWFRNWCRSEQWP